MVGLRRRCTLNSRLDLIVNTVVVVLTVLLLAALARVIWLAAEILLIILIAAILATGLSPLVESLKARSWGRRRWHLPHGMAIAAVYVGLLVGVGLIVSMLVTPIVAETRQLVEQAPELYQQLTGMLRSFQQRYRWLPDFSGLIARLPQEVGRLGGYLSAATGVAFRVFGGIVSTVSVLVLSIYMLVEGPAIKQGFLQLFPHRHRRRVSDVLHHIALKFGGWLRGQLILGLVIGVAAGLGTWALGLPYPFLLGLVAGVTELIPMVGPVLGAIPAIIVALFGPWWRLIAVIVLFIAIQLAENNLLVPRVMKMSVGLSPLLTLAAIMVGANLMGILGALLAVPIAAALQVIVGEIVRVFVAPK